MAVAAPSLGQVDLTKLNRSELAKLRAILTPKISQYCPHMPMPKQAAFMLLDNKEAFYGGAAGGGKSDALLMDGLQNVDVKGYAGIIFRKNYSDLVKPGALIDRAKEWLLQYDDVKWVEKERRFNFNERYGPHSDIRSILQFGYLENDNDRFNYQGGEYQYIGFDELTHISEVCYRYMFSRLRRLKSAKVPLKVRSASNPPDDDSGVWVYHRFVDPKTKRRNAIFVPAGLDDNPYLDVESYEESLEELDPVTRARLRDGNWEIRRKGNMFKREWFETVDVVPNYRRRVRYWDLAATEKKKTRGRNNEPDYTIGFLMSEASGIYYIEDIIRFRAKPMAVEDTMRRTAVSDGHRTAIRQEQEPGSNSLILIDTLGRTTFKGFDYKGVPTSSTSKILRANPVSSAAERGHIKIVRGCRNVEVFFNEIESFPGGMHDDMVDGFSGSYKALSNMPMMVAPMGVSVASNSYWGAFSGMDQEFGAAGYWRQSG